MSGLAGGSASKDWRPEIVRLVQLKQQVHEADTEGLWDYRLPKAAATEQELVAAESHLGFRLDPGYRSFLSYANGWDAFDQTIDLFGTGDLLGSPRYEYANQSLDWIEPVVWDQVGLARSVVVPIADTSEDLDIFVMPVVNGQQTPPVVWLAGGEIERYPTFEDYVLAMIGYNARELRRFRGELS